MLRQFLHGLWMMGLCVCILYASLIAFFYVENYTRSWRLKIEENRRQIEKDTPKHRNPVQPMQKEQSSE